MRSAKKLLLQFAHRYAELLGFAQRMALAVLAFECGIEVGEPNTLSGRNTKIFNEVFAGHCFSIAGVYSPRRAATLHWARCTRAFCAAATLASSPCQICMAGSWIARANENANPQGIRPLNRAFIALSRADASSPDWPPERNATPGTAAGTVRRRQRTVASAISSFEFWLRALQSGNDHIGLQNHAFEQDSLRHELRKNGVLSSFRNLGTTLHRMVAIHQHFGFDDGNQAGLLAQAPHTARESRAFASRQPSLGMPSPIVMTARHLAKRAPIFTYSASRSRSPSSPSVIFSSGMRSHRLGSSVDLDAGNNADLFQCLCERDSRSRLLTNSFVHQDGAVQTITESRGSDNHVAIGAPHLLGLRNADRGKAFVGGRCTFIHGQQAFVTGDHGFCRIVQLTSIHLRLSFLSIILKSAEL